MSSKKQRRQERRRQEREGGASSRNPVTMFIIAIGVALIVVTAIALVVRESPGEPPFPGAVWSDAHGHWH